MKELIRQTVIEGKNGAVFNKLIQLGRQRDNIQKLILDFFGPDNARQSVKDRQVRSEFNLQISVPVVCYFLELLKNNENSKYNLGFKDIFKGVYPSDRVLNHFSNHFGFRVEDIEWNYDKTFISNIVERTFDSLVGKISVVLSYYGCDIVLLSGRPSSLKPLSDLFYKYCAVSPNRLITMSDYKIGTWYPFQDGRGYFKDAKSIVAVGAMIGNYASSRGSLGGFSLNLSELYAKMGSTAEYFAKTEKSDPFITPGIHSVSLNIAEIPSKFWCRQLDTPNYPTRPFYKLSFNFGQLKSHVISRYSVNENDEKAIKLYLDQERERLIRLAPFTVQIDRENYPLDKETLNLISIVDKNGDNHPVKFFSLQVQSMAEDENYWLDSGEFINL